MFRLDLDRISDVVVIPFRECYPRSCRFCDFGVKPRGKFGFLSTPIESFSKHIEPSQMEKIAGWNADNYIILGGEPTLSKYLVGDIIKPIRDNTDGKVIVYTNGFLLGKFLKVKGKNHTRVREFVESVDRLVISMEGSKPYNDAVRGIGMTDLAHYIIDQLAEEVDIAVRMGFHPKNLKYVVEEMEILADKGVSVLLFPRLDMPPLSVEQAYEFYHFVAGSGNAWILLPSFTNFVEEFAGRREGKPCPAGWLKLCVWMDGRITPCQWIDYTIATLDNDDEEIEEYANRWVEMNFLPKLECQSCRYRDVCRGGCRAAEDWRWCPLRVEAVPEEGEVSMFGAVREVSRAKVKAEIKKLDGIVVHGCSAGC